MADDLFTEYVRIIRQPLVRVTEENLLQVAAAVGATVHFGSTTAAGLPMVLNGSHHGIEVGQWITDGGTGYGGNSETPDGYVLPQEITDGHHTFADLYDYRLLYHAHAAHGWAVAGIPVVKSWRHHDGEKCFGGGWFIVTATLPTGQISNHYEAEHWELFAVPAVDRPPEWDGHTPAEAAERLRDAARLGLFRPTETTTETPGDTNRG